MISLKKTRGRSDVHCEGNNENCKNETVFGKKLHCESGSLRIGNLDFRRFLKEARDERGCEIFETFSTDGLDEFLMSIGRYGTSTKENGTHHKNKIRRSLQVKDGDKKVRSSRESAGVRQKKGDGSS